MLSPEEIFLPGEDIQDPAAVEIIPAHGIL
jgi:hypothetical protein